MIGGLVPELVRVTRPLGATLKWPETGLVEGVEMTPASFWSKPPLKEPVGVPLKKLKEPTWTLEPPVTELELPWMYTTALPLRALLVKAQPPVEGQKLVDCRNAPAAYREWLASTGSVLTINRKLALPT